MRRVFKERNKQVGEINAQVEDSLLGIRVVKSFANEAIEEEKFDKGNKKFLEVKKRSYECMAAFATSNRIFDGLMYIIVVIIGCIADSRRGSSPPAEFTGVFALCQYAADLHPPNCGVHRAVPAGHDGHRAVLTRSWTCPARSPTSPDAKAAGRGARAQSALRT